MDACIEVPRIVVSTGSTFDIEKDKEPILTTEELVALRKKLNQSLHEKRKQISKQRGLIYGRHKT